MERAANILKVDELYVSYGAVKALNGVSLEVNKGEIVALIGANGAGKSTLLEALIGINPADRGTILFDGWDISHMPTDKIVGLGLCLVPEGRGILSLMTVLENLQLGAYHLPKNDFGKYLKRVFEHFPRLEERKKQLAGTLSGGEQQMLSIGRGLMSSPKLLMLDEPSIGLAPVIVAELFDIIEGLNGEGYTILLAEQNARMALQYAHRSYVFATGNIVLSGTCQELADDPRVHQAFLGGGVR